MAQPRSRQQAWDDPELGEASSNISGTRRITHEIDAEFGADRKSNEPVDPAPAKALEQKPALVPTWRAPTPLGTRALRPRLRETLAPWDFEAPLFDTSWLGSNVRALLELVDLDDDEVTLELSESSLTDEELAAIAGDLRETTIEIEEASLSAEELAAIAELEQLGSHASGVRAATPPPREEDALPRIRAAFERGDYFAVLVQGETLLEEHPEAKAALHYVAAARAMLVRRYVEKLGGPSRIPRCRLRQTDLVELDLDPREAFVLTLVDNVATVEEIVDMSGLPQLDVLRILLGLCQRELVHVSVGR